MKKYPSNKFSKPELSKPKFSKPELSKPELSKLSEHIDKKTNVEITLTIAQKSSKITKRISSVWAHIYQSQPFSGAEANVSQAVHFNNGELIIECDSPTVLNHLRFNQSHLIKQLHRYSFNDVNSLRLTIKQKSHHDCFPENLTEKKQTITARYREKISENSLKTIETCAKTTSSTSLKKSLDTLLKSLKNL